MDSHAYLTRQGWQGLGHPLQPSGRGIEKPLLASKKGNTLGVGKKKHDVHADQWWARAFDIGLKRLEVGKAGTTMETKATMISQGLGALEMPRAGVGKWAGLYDQFVKGEGFSGTLASSVSQETGLIPSTQFNIQEAITATLKQSSKKRWHVQDYTEDSIENTACEEGKREQKRKSIRPRNESAGSSAGHPASAYDVLDVSGHRTMSARPERKRTRR